MPLDEKRQADPRLFLFGSDASTILDGAQADREAALHAPQSSGARVGARTRAVAVGSYRSYAFGEEGAVRINQWGEAKMKIATPAA